MTAYIHTISNISRQRRVLEACSRITFSCRNFPYCTPDRFLHFLIPASNSIIRGLPNSSNREFYGVRTVVLDCIQVYPVSATPCFESLQNSAVIG